MSRAVFMLLLGFAAASGYASEGDEPLTPSLTRFLSERGLSLHPYTGCAPYTQPPFDLRFDQALSSDCAY